MLNDQDLIIRTLVHYIYLLRLFHQSAMECLSFLDAKIFVKLEDILSVDTVIPGEDLV